MRGRSWALLSGGALLAVAIASSGSMAPNATTYAAPNAQAEPAPTPPPGSNPEGHIVEPEMIPRDPSLMANLKLPQGFWIEPWATGLKNTRNMVVAPDGMLYVTGRCAGA